MTIARQPAPTDLDERHAAMRRAPAGADRGLGVPSPDLSASVRPITLAAVVAPAGTGGDGVRGTGPAGTGPADAGPAGRGPGGTNAEPLPLPEPAARRWVAMREATDLLGVSPATLRRWADAGQLPIYTTPGGHRRFERATLIALIRRAELPGGPRPTPLPGSRSGAGSTRLLRDAARGTTSTLTGRDPASAFRRPGGEAPGARRPTGAAAGADGEVLAGVPLAAREPLRGHGLRISNALLASLEGPPAEREVGFESAREAATAFGWIAGSVGASLRDTVETFQTFRLPLMRQLSETARGRRLDACGTGDLLVAATDAMDRLLESIMHGHEVARPRGLRSGHR